MAHYPKLKKKLGLIGAFCLIVWATFILAMQVISFLKSGVQLKKTILIKFN
jgi:hypothetical protein